MTAELCACESVTLRLSLLVQNVSQLQLKGAGRDLGSVVQSQHCVPHHQGSTEEVQDARSRGARERGLSCL